MYDHNDAEHRIEGTVIAISMYWIGVIHIHRNTKIVDNITPTI